MKRVFFWLAAAAALSMGGCGKDAGSPGTPVLIWWQIGSAQGGIAQDMSLISDYVQEKIGVRVDIKQAGWGDAAQRFTTMINAGEYYDILFTDLSSYNRYVALGAFADLTDILPVEAPQLWNAIPDVLWEGIRIRGRIYSVPTYKDSSKTLYHFWDHGVVEKYGHVKGIIPSPFPGLDRPQGPIQPGP